MELSAAKDNRNAFLATLQPTTTETELREDIRWTICQNCSQNSVRFSIKAINSLANELIGRIKHALLR